MDIAKRDVIEITFDRLGSVTLKAEEESG